MDTETPKPKLRQRLREAVSEAMLDAAEAVMIQRGYDKATMQEIADAAGCATGTFYLYFKNKEVLLEGIIARRSSEMFELARPELDRPLPPLHRVKLGLEKLINYAREHRPLFRLVFTALPVRHRALQQKMGPQTREVHDEYDRVELELLRQAQRDGSIRADLSVEVLQDFMTDVGFGIIERMVFSDLELGLDEQMRITWGLITGGMGARSAS